MSKTISLEAFIKGINNVAKETNLPEGFLREALNVDIDKEGVIRRRSGYTQVYSGTNCHSLYKNYFVEAGELKKLNDDYSASVMVSGLDPNRYLSYDDVNDKIIYTNGRINGFVDGNTLSVPNPLSQPNLSETTGLLTAGTYSIAICHINFSTGEISGTGKSKQITVGDNSGILLTNIPNNSYGTAIFMSNANGEELFFTASISPGNTSYTVVSTGNSRRVLDTQHMTALPAGQLIQYHDGRLYVADDTTLWFSQPMRLGLCKLQENFFQFKSRITVLLAVENGLFVVADKAYFLTGGVVKDMTLKEVHRSTGIPGTGIKLDSR